ncbi:hypothetical protein SRB5_33390 [Streptomyces sp. RB5]|uniref:DUF1906 domain-containing protein n=1 Tax=Streptomyces smaragdinus TaxID=2585196 RepID=A0A7K0CID8_9ACTN|nr:glycoside hydrolase domain-containing protein [Streptomyces smaragdinus]MQY13196.1 hypothetical protein [Streptomyces smaragdinus]
MRLRTPLRRGAAWAAALAGLAALAGPPAAAAAPASDGTRTVAYHGYRITVPDDWRVVDLTANPRACVRFDRPAVYLGAPGEDNDCPAHLVGRTAGVVVEPIDARSARHAGRATAHAARGKAHAPGAASSNDTIQVAVEDAGVLVTAAHTPQSEGLVRGVLTTAKLDKGAVRTALPAPAPETSTLAAAGPQPGAYNGRGFDACAAPSTAAMNAWQASSPYSAVGVYISGSFRGCSQPNLTASWVTSQTNNGWRLFPIDVGRQAPCTSFSLKMSTDPATAKSQGVTAAAAAITAAANLGIPAGSAIYSDIEGYASTASCKASVLSYLSGWTQRLHQSGYLSGFYSSASSGIRDAAAEYNNTAYTRVDHLYYAWWNGVADTNTGSYVPSTYWANHQRIHQYAGEVTESYGGYSINIDRDQLDLGTGTTPPTPTCTGVNIDFTAYGTIKSGSSGSLVTAAQCLLKAAGYDPGTPDGSFGPNTTAATVSFQASRGLTADGVIGPKSWTALLSRGTTPVIKSGATGEPVQRLQRALTAALGRTIAIDGSFGPATDAAVRDYQSSRGLAVDGVVGAASWGALQAGR